MGQGMTSDNELITFTEVKNRGWSERLIASIVGDPDELKRNPNYKITRAGLRLSSMRWLEFWPQKREKNSADTRQGMRSAPPAPQRPQQQNKRT